MDSWVRTIPYGGISPTIPESVFVAPYAVIVGDVVIGEESSVWYHTTARGDVNRIRIGSRTNIQDNSVLHVTHDTHPLLIGDNVTCGHAVRLHGCTIHDETLIGIGAIVLDGAVVESGAIVAAGSLVPPGMVVRSGTIVAGVPARMLRELRPAEREDILASADRYVEYARVSRSELGEWPNE